MLFLNSSDKKGSFPTKTIIICEFSKGKLIYGKYMSYNKKGRKIRKYSLCIDIIKVNFEVTDIVDYKSYIFYLSNTQCISMRICIFNSILMTRVILFKIKIDHIINLIYNEM